MVKQNSEEQGGELHRLNGLSDVRGQEIFTEGREGNEGKEKAKLQAPTSKFQRNIKFQTSKCPGREPGGNFTEGHEDNEEDSVKDEETD